MILNRVRPMLWHSILGHLAFQVLWLVMVAYRGYQLDVRSQLIIQAKDPGLRGLVSSVRSNKNYVSQSKTSSRRNYIETV